MHDTIFDLWCELSANPLDPADKVYQHLGPAVMQLHLELDAIDLYKCIYHVIEWIKGAQRVYKMWITV